MEKIETMEQFWQCADTMAEGFLFAMFTDEIVWESWPLTSEKRENFRKKEGKLLDVRIFNKEKEVRMFRGDIGRKLQGRSIDDGKDILKQQEYFDEEQYLDIDDKRSEEVFAREKKVVATGGGCYSLPLPGFVDAKVRLRNYLGYYEETGQVYVRDWRLMGLFQERPGQVQSQRRRK